MLIHESFVLTPRFFPLKTKRCFYRHPVECRLEYTDFVKIGQPKLSERKSQRSWLFVSTSYSLLDNNFLSLGLLVESKYIMKKQSQILSNSAFVYRILWITNLLEIQGNPSSILEKSPWGFGFNRIN